jgi:hypothetical protein
MLIAMIVAARWVIRRFHVPSTLPATIPVGMVALGLLLPAEIAGVLWLRRLSMREYLILPLEHLRWISFSHFEADECGALNEFLAAAPHAMPRPRSCWSLGSSAV